MPNEPRHFENLRSNITEVLRLVEIHTKMTGSAPGRRHNVAILNKSGIVLAVACWEAFVEDLASYAFTWLLDRATVPTVFPRSVLALASKEVRAAQDTSRVWELAGGGWRNVLVKHKDEIIARYVGRLNTPRPKQVDELFDELLGISAMSSMWRWHNVSNNKVKQTLDQLITLRGEIAHRVVSSRSVKKFEVDAAAVLVQRLAVISSNVVRSFLITRTKEIPWAQYEYSDVEVQSGGTASPPSRA